MRACARYVGLRAGASGAQRHVLLRGFAPCVSNQKTLTALVGEADDHTVLAVNGALRSAGTYSRSRGSVARVLRQHGRMRVERVHDVAVARRERVEVRGLRAPSEGVQSRAGPLPTLAHGRVQRAAVQRTRVHRAQLLAREGLEVVLVEEALTHLRTTCLLPRETTEPLHWCTVSTTHVRVRLDLMSAVSEAKAAQVSEPQSDDDARLQHLRRELWKDPGVCRELRRRIEGLHIDGIPRPEVSHGNAPPSGARSFSDKDFASAE